MRVVGVVVAVDEFHGRRVYTLDDSSGACIECLVTIPSTGNADGKEKGKESGQKTDDANPPTPARVLDFRVGNVIDVKGGLSIYRDEKQLTVEKADTVRSTAQEVALWQKRARFRQDVLDKPWVLHSRDIRRCRKEAEHSEEKAERKRRRLAATLERRTAAAAEPEKPPTEKAKRSTRGDKEPTFDSKASLDRILRQGGQGKYDALGL